jgi:oxygen-independent coproporphyrinogen-3 oxidase
MQPDSNGLRLQALPPLTLYVHLPWCVRKCPYCDFNSHPTHNPIPETDYVAALVADLERALPDVWGRPVYTIFFGGGTPSLFSARAIEELLAAFRARLPIAADAEITLEANPGTVEADKFRDYRAAGVNRLSLGVQSFNARHLLALGRIHDADEARRAIDIAQHHFDNYNLDVMYALPVQTIEEAHADVMAAIATGAPHLSCYHLTLEPGTPFHRNPPAIPGDDDAADIHDMVATTLEAAGYAHYEVSAYARQGRECRHNLNYWRFGDYLGIGAGAHSKLTFHDRIVREARVRTPKDYMQGASGGDAIQERRVLTRNELPFEFMLNAMRLTEGFTVRDFVERTGLSIAAAEAPLREAEAKGLIERSRVRIRPSARGRRYLNDLLELFLEE